MVRTKDLLLIVVVLVMLGMAISATMANRMMKDQQLDGGLVAQQTVQAPQYEAVSSLDSDDQRQATIERLRSLIAQGDVIESSPSVESSSVSESELGGTYVSNCLSPDTGIAIARQWPLTGVSVNTVGASRVVSQVVPAEATAPTASGTIPAAAPDKILLQLPVSPSKQSEPTCVDSEIVGVTVDGSLIFNGDVVLYRGSSAETLIGYARDGFPIYGAYSGAMDQCGGYDGAGGYRYTASPTQNRLLSCFVGQPQSFSL